MSDHDALLAAVIADKDSDTPRLVMADWYEENGHELRAEWIRVQIDFSRSSEWPDVPKPDHVSELNWRRTKGTRHDRKWRRLAAREKELHAIGTEPGGFLEVPGWLGTVTWRRGFVDSIRVGWGQLVGGEHLSCLVRGYPVREVEFTQDVQMDVRHHIRFLPTDAGIRWLPPWRTQTRMVEDRGEFVMELPHQCEAKLPAFNQRAWLGGELEPEELWFDIVECRRSASGGFVGECHECRTRWVFHSAYRQFTIDQLIAADQRRTGNEVVVRDPRTFITHGAS